MSRPIVTPGYHNGERGEFSTVEVEGWIETVFFPDNPDAPSYGVAATPIPTLAHTHRRHLESL